MATSTRMVRVGVAGRALKLSLYKIGGRNHAIWLCETAGEHE